MGKTSLVKKVISTFDNSSIKMVYIDAYDCRSEYDFYNKFASAVLRQTSNKTEQWLDNVRDFLSRASPQISFSPDPTADFSLSLGLTEKNHSPEEILRLPELIAQKKGIHIVVCIDEFQQIGEFPESLEVQKRLRSVWQHQQLTSYCLFGSKKHFMTQLFQSRRMPFYQFGEMIFLEKIQTADWVPYIQSRFAGRGKQISTEYCEQICRLTDCYSSYVQQLSWNVLAETEQVVGPDEMQHGIEALLSQCDALFIEQIRGLTSFQMNFLRAVTDGIHQEFGAKTVTDRYNFGSKSNLVRIKQALIEKELIDDRFDEGIYLADPIFKLWFERYSRK